MNSHIEAMERNSRDHLKKPLHIHLKLVCIPVLHIPYASVLPSKFVDMLLIQHW